MAKVLVECQLCAAPDGTFTLTLSVTGISARERALEIAEDLRIPTRDAVAKYGKVIGEGRGPIGRA